ncbi:hypothetical protein B0T14DRAFT_127424 [Immersiella caudata]|uniref:Uncharacterized protein n=1 Tax=Immersiella caudata TaxID=314043 RepID=A0AA39X4K5_9PEZI|nr:hypothetical protein B0T14DRAFT_127424 [Immersiella caudata]
MWQPTFSQTQDPQPPTQTVSQEPRLDQARNAMGLKILPQDEESIRNFHNKQSKRDRSRKPRSISPKSRSPISRNRRERRSPIRPPGSVSPRLTSEAAEIQSRRPQEHELSVQHNQVPEGSAQQTIQNPLQNEILSPDPILPRPKRKAAEQLSIASNDIRTPRRGERSRLLSRESTNDVQTPRRSERFRLRDEIQTPRRSERLRLRDEIQTPRRSERLRLRTPHQPLDHRSVLQHRRKAKWADPIKKPGRAKAGSSKRSPVLPPFQLASPPKNRAKNGKRRAIQTNQSEVLKKQNGSDLRASSETPLPLPSDGPSAAPIEHAHEHPELNVNRGVPRTRKEPEAVSPLSEKTPGFPQDDIPERAETPAQLPVSPSGSVSIISQIEQARLEFKNKTALLKHLFSHQTVPHEDGYIEQADGKGKGKEIQVNVSQSTRLTKSADPPQDALKPRRHEVRSERSAAHPGGKGQPRPPIHPPGTSEFRTPGTSGGGLPTTHPITSSSERSPTRQRRSAVHPPGPSTSSSKRVNPKNAEFPNHPHRTGEVETFSETRLGKPRSYDTEDEEE